MLKALPYIGIGLVAFFFGFVTGNATGEKAGERMGFARGKAEAVQAVNQQIAKTEGMVAHEVRGALAAARDAIRLSNDSGSGNPSAGPNR
jgi:hypothetical protein